VSRDHQASEAQDDVTDASVWWLHVPLIGLVLALSVVMILILDHSMPRHRFVSYLWSLASLVLTVSLNIYLRFRQPGGAVHGGVTAFEGSLLYGLTCFLPNRERSRFVTEALGNLNDCEHWWQRVDYLVGLALGTPRLAWMMWREGRRRV
jgi:hypothetical protein